MAGSRRRAWNYKVKAGDASVGKAPTRCGELVGQLAYHLKTRARASHQVMKVSINPLRTGTT
ncbi:hypothetical protein F2P45_31025 [Massilia sp. CCM 8733]|uniref:Uncharacterized protein n=1 Tax=Massilia mucilaginosa TaxID=2609282 RepID=A0ABX0P285_9BURK|nr:hypothetical protein [Massilia mucilaginosa]NHZ93408.1 hypothetical protein [Massilia mucilaginosa]